MPFLSVLAAYSPFFWITAVVAVVMFGIAKSGFGGGIGIIAVPLLALTMPVPEASALLLPLLIFIDLLNVRYYRHQFDRRNIKLLVPGAIIGIAIGGLFFTYFSDNERILEIGIGVLALVFILFQVTRRVILGILEKRQPRPFEGVITGVVAGFTSTIAHVGGPPATMYLLPQQLPRNIFVGTTVIFFTIVNLVKFIPYSMLGLLKTGNLTIALILAPLCLVGVKLGIYLNQRFDDVWFNRVVYSILLLTGLQLIMGKSIISLIT